MAICWNGDCPSALEELLVIDACAPVGVVLPILVASGRDAALPLLSVAAMVSTALTPVAATFAIALLRV